MTLWRVDRNVIQKKWQCTGNSKTYMYVRIIVPRNYMLAWFSGTLWAYLFPKGLPWRWSTSVVVHSSVSFFSDSSLCSSSNYGSAGSGERYLPRNSHFVMSIAKPDWLPLDARDADGLPPPSCPPEFSLEVNCTFKLADEWIRFTIVLIFLYFTLCKAFTQMYVGRRTK